MLRQRVLSAIVIVIAAIVPAVLGHPVLTGALIVLATLAVVEFARAVRVAGADALTWPAGLVVAALIVATGFDLSATVLLAMFVLGSLGLFFGAIIRGAITGSTRDYAFSIAAVTYIGIPIAHLPLIRNHGNESDNAASWIQTVNDLSLVSHPAAGLAWLVLVVAVTWMTDSAAYLGGRAFGKHKLAPTLSPAKTIEGAVAGAIVGALTGAGFTMLLGLPVPVYAGAGIGLLLSIFGQFGDLAESLIKRDLGVKDMGDLIPGHGGILDRIDALLFTLPVGYYLILVATEVNWP